jgi:uncharacterized protein
VPSVTPVFVDTSALFAVLAANDANHGAAERAWFRLLDGLRSGSIFAVTHSGVVTEAAALVQRRLGMGAMAALLDDVLPLFEIVWVDERLHREAAVATLAAAQREVSLVDWTSFLVMRAQAISTAFAFDDDFAVQGFAPFAHHQDGRSGL